jgi:hypothetical protein
VKSRNKAVTNRKNTVARLILSFLNIVIFIK